MTKSNPKVSVVIGCRNEEDNVVAMTQAVRHQLDALGLDFELIYIDNASVDRTVELVKAQCALDPRVKLIENQGNFGQLRSPVHALFQATGDVVIGMCADFQDPPELIPAFIEGWREGYPVVLGVRKVEVGNTWMHRQLRSLGYWFAQRVFDQPLVANATGFGLHDRAVLEVLKTLKEPEPLMRTLLLEFGWPYKLIEFHRPERAGGRSNNNFFTLVDFSISAVSSSAKRLIRYSTYLGVVLMLLALPTLLVDVVVHHELGPWGWAALLELNFAILFIFVGLLGDQVRLIGERVRQTPLVVEKHRTNFE